MLRLENYDVYQVVLNHNDPVWRERILKGHHYSVVQAIT